MKYGEYIFGSIGEKLSLSAQFIAFECLQAGSNTTSVDFSALWLEVKKKPVNLHLLKVPVIICVFADQQRHLEINTV